MQLLHPETHDVLHFVENLQIYILIRLFHIDLIRNATLTQMLLTLDLVKLGGCSTIASVRFFLD